MQTRYRHSVAVLDEKFPCSVQALFPKPKEDIEIVISSARDDTTYLLSSESNRQHLEAALEDAREGRNLIRVPLEQLQAPTALRTLAEGTAG